MTVALCLLTWNEIDGVKHDLPLLDRSRFDQVYCIDGGSTDGTVEYLQDCGIEVYRQREKGLNNACYEGAERCRCDAFVFFHPKGTVPVEDTYRFREYFEAGYGFVVASRMIDGAVNEEDKKLFRPRKWFVLWLALVTSLLFRKSGARVWDVLHGFRGMVKADFDAMPRNDGGCTIDLDMVCHAYRSNVKRIEFPTSESSRIGGETHFKAWKTGKKLLAGLWREFRRGRS